MSQGQGKGGKPEALTEEGWVMGGFLGLRRLAISGRNRVTCNAQSVVPNDGAHARMQDAAARRLEAQSLERMDVHLYNLARTQEEAEASKTAPILWSVQ